MKEFLEPDNLAVFTCTHVMKGGDPILYVFHDMDDGGWQFLCGAPQHLNSDAMIVALSEIVDVDASVRDVADMPVGNCASRKDRHDSWAIAACE